MGPMVMISAVRGARRASAPSSRRDAVWLRKSTPIRMGECEVGEQDQPFQRSGDVTQAYEIKNACAVVPHRPTA